MPSDKITEMLQRIAAGDQLAFKQVYQELSSSVFGAAMSYLKDESTAREIVQLSFIRLWENREKLKEVQNLKSYLFKIAHNLVFDYFRQLMREKRLKARQHRLFETSPDEASRRLEQNQMDILFQSAVKKLSPQQQKVYKLKKEGFGCDEIAEKMQLSQNTVRKHLQLANGYVREFIKTNLSTVVMVLLIQVARQFIF
jgi:RNA polymerase sigma-70 factor (family 1)